MRKPRIKSRLCPSRLPGQEKNDLEQESIISLGLICKWASQTTCSLEFLLPLTLGSGPQNTWGVKWCWLNGIISPELPLVHHSFIDSFTQLSLFLALLDGWHCSWCWGYKGKLNKHNSCPHRAIVFQAQSPLPLLFVFYPVNDSHHFSQNALSMFVSSPNTKAQTWSNPMWSHAETTADLSILPALTSCK